MRDKIKNICLILAIIIAGVSLPIGIIAFNRPAETTVIFNNYYYNTTIIEQYNYTISNNTMEFYRFDNVMESVLPFFNKTYNITENGYMIFSMNINYTYAPRVVIRKNGVSIIESPNINPPYYKTLFVIGISIGIYNIEITNNYINLPSYNIELFIGIFYNLI